MRYRVKPSALLVILLCAFVSFAPAAWGAASPRSDSPKENDAQSSGTATVTIPGPLRPFLRMAAISQKVSPSEVMPLLARNVFLRGYQSQGPSIEPNEFLRLLRRYVQQARELASLAGPYGVIRVSGCADAKELLQVLGYSEGPDCGKSDTSLDTEDSQRVFLTVDSGFPLSDLEKTLQGGGPFAYSFQNSRVPVLLTEREWMDAGREAKERKGAAGLLDAILYYPDMARLYYAWSRIDPETEITLQRSPGLKKLLPIGSSLDFYGAYIRIRSGRVLVPGGPDAENAWRDLVGASPESPGEFVLRLLERDNGWLAAYYDSLARVEPTQQAHFTGSPQLRRLYEAFRGKNESSSATASVLRPDANLLLLITRLQWSPGGNLQVPGSLQAWKDILGQKAFSGPAHDQGVHVAAWDTSEGLLEALFALSRVQMDGGPCDAYLMLNELDRRRPEGHRLSSQTVELMAGKFSDFRNQYLIFSEFPDLTDASITLFLKTAVAFGKIPNHVLRGNAMGIFEANVGLWQIMARQGQIPAGNQDSSWQEVIKPFAQITSSAQLFDAGHKSLEELLRAATGNPKGSQDEIVDLIAGPAQTSAPGQQMHAQMADRIRAVLEDQRLVSLDTLFALGDGLNAMERGSSTGDNLIPLAEELQEFQMPRPIFSRSERTLWTQGTYNDQHTELQMRTDIAKIIKSSPSSEQLEDARGQLTSFLRDSLVGLNYAYYEPPGAQTLHNNPLLVRSHDFSGETVMGVERELWQTPRVFGAGSPASGGAHLVGSLADLPYVLAELEQDFVAPENVQALIWSDLVPGVLTDAVLPRWWGVTPNELHAVALYQRTGEELLAASVNDEKLRGKVMDSLSDRMVPQRSSLLQSALQDGRLAEVSPQMTPADMFYLTAEFRRRYPGEIKSSGPAGQELESISLQYPDELRWDRLSQDFGVPHPVLARTYAREMLNIRPLPMFQGFSSRLLAETWDSTNLYWARLADEMGYPPVVMNRLVPELTLRMVSKIFATDVDDWPAILRAMKETGEEFRKGKFASLQGYAAGP